MTTAERKQNSTAPSQQKDQRIRVLHSVGHLLRGGIETWLYQILQRFDPSEFEHHVLVRTDKEELFTKAFRNAGFRVLPCLNFQNPMKYKANLRRLIEQNGPYDVLHVHGSNPNGLLAMFFAKTLGIPTSLVHSHNDLRPLLENRGKLYRSYVGLTLQGLRKYADRGFAVSVRAAESMFGGDWESDKRWELMYCGIDFEPFAQAQDPGLRKTLGIPEDAFVVGHAGRFHEQKNHSFLLKIANEVIKKNPHAHFLMIGDGALRDQIISEVHALGLDRQATFVRDTLIMPQFMRSAMDCFVLPSRYEGLPLVSVEAQAAGLPCVFPDHLTKELVVDPGLVKFLSLTDSPEMWADAILMGKGKKIQDPDTHLKQFYASRFNLQKCATSLGEIYQSLAVRSIPSASSSNTNAESSYWKRAG